MHYKPAYVPRRSQVSPPLLRTANQAALTAMHGCFERRRHHRNMTGSLTQYAIQAEFAFAHAHLDAFTSASFFCDMKASAGRTLSLRHHNPLDTFEQERCPLAREGAELIVQGKAKGSESEVGTQRRRVTVVLLHHVSSTPGLLQLSITKDQPALSQPGQAADLCHLSS